MVVITLPESLGIPSVIFLDRKPLIDYLTRKISSSDSIKFTLPPQNGVIHHPKIPTALDSASNGNHIGNDNGDYAALDSRVFTQIETHVDYMYLICSNDRPLKDREGFLECKGKNFFVVLTSATKREEERHRIKSQQRKYGLVAKNRLMGSDERGLTGFGDESGYDPNTKPKLHLK
ncbi:hypothetical protein TB1_042321 [Malus domestica]